MIGFRVSEGPIRTCSEFMLFQASIIPSTPRAA